MARTDRCVRRTVVAVASVLCLALSLSRSLAAERALRIAVIEGDGALNSIAFRRARVPIVRVEDGSGHPIPEAAVTFMLPDMGPGGTFEGGRLLLTVASDRNGIAAARGLRPNNVAGPFEIFLSASHNGNVATASLNQTNVAGARTSTNRRKVVLIAALAGGAGVATGIAIRHAGSGKLSAPVAVGPVSGPPVPVTMIPAFAPAPSTGLLSLVETPTETPYGGVFPPSCATGFLYSPESILEMLSER